MERDGAILSQIFLLDNQTRAAVSRKLCPIVTPWHLQLEHEFPEVALGGLLRHDVAHLLAHRSDLRRLGVAGLLDLVLLLLSEADARLKTRRRTSRKQQQQQPW